MERSCSVRRPRRRLPRRDCPVRSAALAVLVFAIAVPAAAQDGGVVAEFCKDDRLCVDDTLEIVFESGGSTYAGPVEAGVEVPIEVVIDTRSPEIQGYSWAVKHDGEVLELIAGSVTAAGTIIDPESPDTSIRGEPFLIHRAVEGGFVSAVVLSLREKASLPFGRHVVCRAAYRIAARPECTVIRFVDRQLAVTKSPSVGINITTRGLGRSPRILRQGLIGTGDCPETCDDLADNDGDGLADCEDADCSLDLHCTGEEDCDDGIDNDSNGWVDCRDPDCGDFPGCPLEECVDGLDNDGDGLRDCVDPDCRGADACKEICDDLIDNDADSAIDCQDRDCGGVAGCPEFELCGDGRDNDGDGLSDCADSDCWNLPACRTSEVCDDGADNDRDGAIDCRDSDCRGDVACQEKCDDGIDNDLDSLTDCNDRDCGGIAGCPEFEACGDGRDNDEDGLTDCEDPECLWQEPCVEVCGDGIDNDGDGFLDALDRDCFPQGVVLPGAAPLPPSAFLRGDADADGRLTIVDAVLLIQILVRAADPRDDCHEALNPDGDDGVSLADAIYLVRWIFLDGPPPPDPFPACESSFVWCGRSIAICP